jgi:hypothetical protein
LGQRSHAGRKDRHFQPIIRLSGREYVKPKPAFGRGSSAAFPLCVARMRLATMACKVHLIFAGKLSFEAVPAAARTGRVEAPP